MWNCDAISHGEISTAYCYVQLFVLVVVVSFLRGTEEIARTLHGRGQETTYAAATVALTGSNRVLLIKCQSSETMALNESDIMTRNVPYFANVCPSGRR